jgi:hypothetical protein
MIHFIKNILRPLYRRYKRARFRLKNPPYKIAALCEEKSNKYNVIKEIHQNDLIFEFILHHPSFNNTETAVNYYFEDGAHSAEKLKNLISDIRNVDEPFLLLEFASGYGCVSRHLRNFLPKASCTCCDIHIDAVNFITNKLNTSAILSNSEPEKLILPDNYDVIFALSFFSHMPKRTWSRWFNVLANKLKKDGCMLFTTHGVKSMPLFNNPELDSDGYYFASMSEQHDIARIEYGSTIVLPKFVYKVCEEAGLRDVTFYEGYWWGHQDLYVVKYPAHRAGYSAGEFDKESLNTPQL